jgi:hypothetical protein
MLPSSVVPRPFLRRTQAHSFSLPQQMMRHRGSSLQPDQCHKFGTACAGVQDRISDEPSVFLDLLHGDLSISNGEGSRSRKGDETRAGGVSIPVGVCTASRIQGRGMMVAGR